MNQAPFSIPGLMPVSTPKETAQRYAFPDGSLVLHLRDEYETTPLTFAVVVSAPSGRILLSETAGERIYSEIKIPAGEAQPALLSYYFALSDTEPLPVGTVRVDAYASDGVNSTWSVSNLDNPHNKGRGSRFTPQPGRPWVYVLKGTHILEVDFETGFLTFPREFSSPPEKVMVTLTKDSELVSISTLVNDITHLGFNLTVGNPIPDDGSVYRAEWVLWTQSLPIILGDFESEVGPYHPA